MQLATSEINAALERATVGERLSDPEFVARYPIARRFSPHVAARSFGRRRQRGIFIMRLLRSALGVAVAGGMFAGCATTVTTPNTNLYDDAAPATCANGFARTRAGWSD